MHCSRTSSGRLSACVLALAGSLVLSACAGMDEAQEQKEDKVARAEYFETAAVTYYDGGRYDLAMGQFRRVLGEEPNNKKAKRGLARSLYMQAAGSPQLSRKERAAYLREAQELLESIINLEWANPGGTGSRRYEVQTDLALVYADLADLYDRDIRDLRRALERDPTATESKYAGTIDIQLGKRNALLHKAIPLFNEVLVASPDNPYALAGLAKVHLQMGADDLGVEYAHRYLTLSQKSQHQWSQQLDMYAEAVQGRVTRQQRKFYLDKIHGARDKEKRMHLMLASVHMRRNEFGQAATAYTEVIKIDSAVPAAYLERAQALGALQQYGQAVTDLEEYLKITDPALHRTQRMQAVELLDRYQGALARRGSSPLGRRAALNSTPRRSAPVRAPTAGRRPGDAVGSPDGGGSRGGNSAGGNSAGGNSAGGNSAGGKAVGSPDGG